MGGCKPARRWRAQSQIETREGSISQSGVLAKGVRAWRSARVFRGKKIGYSRRPPSTRTLRATSSLGSRNHVRSIAHLERPYRLVRRIREDGDLVRRLALHDGRPAISDDEHHDIKDGVAADLLQLDC